VDEKAKVNAIYYVTKLLPNLIKDCRHLLSENFIFQQDGAPAHAAAFVQDWIKTKCPGFTGKKWRPNSPDLSPLDYHVWGMMLGHAIRNTRQNRATLPSWRLPCYRYGMICHVSSLIRQSCHFERDFDRVLLQVNILNNQFKYREGSWHSSLKRLKTFELFTKKLCKVWFVIIEYSGRDCMFTWKSEL